MRIHLSHESDPELFPQFIETLPPGSTATNVGEAPLDTEVLVNGRPSVEELLCLPKLTTLVIPFAGLIPQTREVALGFPNLRVYNLHHNASATAEKAIELLLSAAKRTVPNDAKMRPGPWCPRFDTSDALLLEGKTTVILGFGEIGKRVGKVCTALGMRVIGVSRSGHSENEDVEVVPAERFCEVVPLADALIVCSPFTPETAGMVSRVVIESLPEGAIVVNIGRGGIIDEEALYDGLKSRRLHGAGIDVWWHYPSTEPECEPSLFPFKELDNVVMSPHVGGTVIGTETARLKGLSELLNRLASGDSTLKPMNVELGY